MEAVEIVNVKKEYDNFNLEINNLKIRKGFITGFIGPNGSGKTTTIKLILDMIKKDSGSIKIFGEEYNGNKLDIKQLIGYVGDISGYLHESKLKDIKKHISVFYKNWDEKLYSDYIKTFKLDENKVYKNLSKGQQKKFEFTMALSHHPKLIIMDEPTANLDPLVRNEVLEMLQDTIERDDASVFYSTHITSDLDKVGDYLIFIYNGKILLDDDKDTILNNHSIVKGRRDLINYETKEVFVAIRENSFGFEGLVDNKRKAYEIFGEEVVYDKPNLEDILTYYTRG